jgi:hypothetical protein
VARRTRAELEADNAELVSKLAQIRDDLDQLIEGDETAK